MKRLVINAAALALGWRRAAPLGGNVDDGGAGALKELSKPRPPGRPRRPERSRSPPASPRGKARS